MIRDLRHAFRMLFQTKGWTAVVLVASLAGFLPARRASHVDPLVALRYE